MVVGDRLWLFSQTPNGPAPIQSLVLNNSPQMMPHMSHPSLRNFPQTTAGPPLTQSEILASARNALLTRGQGTMNYGMIPSPKPLNPHQHGYFHMAAMRSQSAMDNPGLRPFQINRSPTEDGSFHFNEGADGFYPNKFLSSSINSSANPNLMATTNSGIADLERAFGNPESLLRDPAKPSGKTPSLDGETDKLKLNQSNESDSCSEIDCEELDDKCI
jgi:hypothetical protein